ncbi:hypothetical protein [Labilibacter marinus]|uniref:hypothetical protein n=1 Tax=Labilibacter marinus TaxID=1477105 RepID=UPI00094FA5B2|nr:hypothetical protein [Labilibacter marinus]
MEKRIHKKRKYSRPQLEVIDVDHEISMVMMTRADNPPGLGGLSIEESQESGPASSYSSSDDSNPFGGNSPDYSN